MIEKNENGVYNHSEKLPQNGAASRTSKVIGDQLGIGKNTVERAADFTQAVDKIVRVTGFT